ncbi:MAG: hypothetical protein NTZ85_07835 [Bacteroidia bacterium]|jgi:hypothetical protein|nr:hypothetical protein [Bacteroidia bacterium]
MEEPDKLITKVEGHPEYQTIPLAHEFPMPLGAEKNAKLYNSMINAKYQYLAACSKAKMEMYNEILAALKRHLRV